MLKAEILDLGIGHVFLEPTFRHLPSAHFLPERKQLQQMRLADNEAVDRCALIDNDGEVWGATERLARNVDLGEVVTWNAQVLAFLPLIPASGLHGDPHEFAGTRVPGDQVDPDVIDVSALKAIFRKPVKDQGLSKVAGDLRMSGTFLNPDSGFRCVVHQNPLRYG